MFPVVFTLFVAGVSGFCGDSIRWSHHVNMDDVYGVWYGVGYAQHTPDMTNKPNEVGCVTLYISDATTEGRDDWLDWSLLRRNYTDQNWKSYRSNPWSDTPMSGSWLDIRVRRRAKRDMYSERRLRIIWDEDGQTMEQIYNYTPDAAGLWVAEKRRPGEQEMISRGIDVWYPDDPPKHPEVIRVLKVNTHMMIINHCSDLGPGGIFSLILRRSPSRMKLDEWYDLQRQFYSFDLPKMYRHSTICAGCTERSSVLCLLVCVAVLKFLYNCYL
ncbi:hypothetical protein ABMA27_011669 [Loxostege sticticalis]|uniref:Uncharacterized protein n=1 Tax=Loxostege sticticalis TaxID=481309 RepID=A0ABR3IH52_LOXSC